jgi:hypothetical protein
MCASGTPVKYPDEIIIIIISSFAAYLGHKNRLKMIKETEISRNEIIKIVLLEKEYSWLILMMIELNIS